MATTCCWSTAFAPQVLGKVPVDTTALSFDATALTLTVNPGNGVAFCVTMPSKLVFDHWRSNFDTLLEDSPLQPRKLVRFLARDNGNAASSESAAPAASGGCFQTLCVRQNASV